MKNKRKVTLFIVVLLVIGIVSLAYTFLFASEIEEFDMYLTVGDYVGLNVDTDALYFGTIFPDGSGYRTLTLGNDGFFSKRVKIDVTGELRDWVWTAENNFILDRNENKEITVHVSVPKDAEFGNYTGRLRMEFRKVYISR